MGNTTCCEGTIKDPKPKVANLNQSPIPTSAPSQTINTPPQPVQQQPSNLRNPEEIEEAYQKVLARVTHLNFGTTKEASNNVKRSVPVPTAPHPTKVVPDKSKPICVTGCNGYIGTYLIEYLLKEGYTQVRGTYWNEKHCGPTETQWVTDLDPSGTKLKLFVAGLVEGGFDEAFKDCEIVIQTACPVQFNMLESDIPKLVLDPSIIGVLNVLSACARQGVKKVVYLSSTCALTDDAIRKYNENDWNTGSTQFQHPFHYAKAEAERVAWEFMAEVPDMQMVSINPCTSLGPSHSPTYINMANKDTVQKHFIRGSYMVHTSYAFVDVRDVVAACVAALNKPDAYGRYPATGHTMWMEDFVKAIATLYPELESRLPTRVITPGEVKLMGKLGKHMAEMLNKWDEYDNSRTTRELGVQFHDPLDTIKAAVDDLKSKGHI